MKILIVDDHAVVRQGVHRLLATIPGASLHEASTAPDALNAVRTLKPDVVVLDINLGASSGLELLQRLQNERPTPRVVIFSMHGEPLYASRAIAAGALGFVTKSAPSEELVTAVRKVAAGERYIDRDLARDLAFTSLTGEDPLQKLSTREIEILRLLAEGKSLGGVADTLGIAYKTVANTCTRLKEKLGVDRTADLIRFAIENLQSR